MDDDEDGALNITPSFKSRSSKGKGRATATATPSRSSEVAVNEEEDNEAGNSSAVVFKSKKNRGKSSLLGDGTSSPSSTSKKATTATPRSRLNNVSFGDADDVGEHTSRASSTTGVDLDLGDESINEGDVSISEVRKLNKKNRRLGGIGSSSLNKAAEK